MAFLLSPIMLLKILPFIIEIATDECESLSFGSQTYFQKLNKHGGSLAPEDIISSHTVQSQTECSLNCLIEGECTGFNYKLTSNKYGKNCQISNKIQSEAFETVGESGEWTFYRQLKIPNDADYGVQTDDDLGINLDDIESCKELYQRRSDFANGYYEFKMLQAYCDLANKGWTLVARFSNADVKHWMGSKLFWYDKVTPHGDISSPSNNTDMISPAFWNVSGDELKITRSDDSKHTALVQTSSRCLQGVPLRTKITSYGAFRNSTEWAEDQCLGRCEVVYSTGGEHENTVGFAEHNCTGSLQSSNYIGFWCYWPFDGAVIMIGGGGDECNRADHGIGITELNSAMFGGELDHYDFGEMNNYIPNAPSTYSLNIWVR